MKRTSIDCTMKYFLYVVLSLVILTWIYVGWILFYPFNPLTPLEDIKILNANKQVKAGENLRYFVHAKKNSHDEGLVYRYLVNSELISLPTYKVCSAPGEIKTTKEVRVPPETYPGIYRLSTVYNYQVSYTPERFVKIVIDSEDFEVVK